MLWAASATLLVLCIWILIKWRARHSLLLKPDALRLDRDNVDHLVGRTDDINNLAQQCLVKPIIFLEGESGSGKSALVRSGLLPRLKDEKTVLLLMLGDLWVDHWDRGPFEALKNAMISSGAFTDDAGGSGAQQLKSAEPHSITLDDIFNTLSTLHDSNRRTAVIVFDQFDDYQARNPERFLPNNIWIDPMTLRAQNPFWEMLGRLLEQNKVRLLFVARSDAAAGLMSVQFLGPVQAMRINRVPSSYMAELLTRLTEPKTVDGHPDVQIIADPEAGWKKLKERIVRDISQQGVVLPQQLKVMLGGIQSLRRLNVRQYEQSGGAAGIEALYVEQQISGTARLVGMDLRQVRRILVELIDPSTSTKTRSRTEADLQAALATFASPPAPDRLDKALVELGRGEMVRSAADPESGTTAYRLDHDYLTRGVLAAERRANRLYHLLEDGADTFESAASQGARWKALLPINAQIRLAWAWLRGMLQYGQYQYYALVSLTRFVPVVLLLVAIGLGWWQVNRWWDGQVASETARQIWLKLEFRRGIGDRDLEGARTLASTNDFRVRQAFVEQMLSTPEYAEHLLVQPDLTIHALIGINARIRDSVMSIIEPSLRSESYSVPIIAAAAIALRSGKVDRIRPSAIVDAVKTTKDTDQLRSLMDAVKAIAPALKPEQAYAIAGSIVDSLKGSANANLLQVIQTISPQLKPEDAYALARPIVDTLKGTTNLKTATSPLEVLRTIVPQLKSEDAYSLLRTFNDGRFKYTMFGPVTQAIASKLTPEEAYAIAGPVFDDVKNTGDANQLQSMKDVVRAITSKLKPEDAYAIARPIVAALNGTTNASSVQAVQFVASRLNSDDAYALARSMIEVIKRNTDNDKAKGLMEGLAVLALRLTPEAARAIGGPVVETIKATTNNDERLQLAYIFAPLAARLTPEDGYGITEPIIETLKKAKNIREIDAPVLSTLAHRVVPKERLPLAISIAEMLRGDSPYLNVSEGNNAADQLLEALSMQLSSEDVMEIAKRLLEGTRGPTFTFSVSTSSSVSFIVYDSGGVIRSNVNRSSA
jgi:hypothetical protein